MVAGADSERDRAESAEARILELEGRTGGCAVGERSANRIGAGCETAFLCQHPAAVGDADRDSRDSSLSGGMRELRNESTQAPVLAALTVQKADGHEQMRRMTIKVPRQPTRAAELSETQECPERCLCTQHG